MVHIGGKQKVNLIIAPLSEIHFYTELKKVPYKTFAVCIHHRLETSQSLNTCKYGPWLSEGQEILEKRISCVGSNSFSYL